MASETKKAPSEKVVINAEGQIAGRIAARAAKMLVGGSEVAIINSEMAIISGTLADKVSRMQSRRAQRNKRNPEEGPKYPRVPHLFLRRIVGGMVPGKSQRGRDAMHRLRCYIGVPKDIDASKAVAPFEKANKPAETLQKSTTVGAVCAAFGWKA